jgi:hypothetical protein
MVDGFEFFKKESWGIRPILDVSDQFPPAVMFSILDSDPRSKYRDTLKKMSEAQNLQRLEPAPFLTPQLMRQGLLSAAWDSVFHDVPGDRVALLYRNASQNVKTEVEDQDATPVVRVNVVGIVSTEPVGTKWLVTRATRFEDKPVCWCKPVEVEKGKTTDVKLTVQDIIDLETI